MKAVLVYDFCDDGVRPEVELVRNFLVERGVPFAEADISRPLPDALLPDLKKGLGNLVLFLTRDDYHSLMLEWNRRVSDEHRISLKRPALLIFEDQDEAHDYRFFGGFEAIKEYFGDEEHSFFVINRLNGKGYKGN